VSLVIIGVFALTISQAKPNAAPIPDTGYALLRGDPPSRLASLQLP